MKGVEAGCVAGVYNLEALKLGLCLVLNAEDFIFF